jgi:hypothetical protein
MADINQTEAGQSVFIVDGGTNEKAAVVTATPSSGEAAIAVREVERGQGTSAASIPVVLASDQSDLNVVTNTEYAEDSVHTSGDVGMFVMAVRNDTLAALGGTDGDYSPLQVDADGALYVTVASTSGSTQVEGDVAHDAVDSGNPVKVGGRAHQTNRTAVADADRTELMTDDVGRLITVSSHVRDLVVKQYTEITNSSENTVLTAGAAGVFHDITAIYMTSSVNNVEVTIRDSTGGSTVWEAHLDQDDPFEMSFNPPLPQATAANNWTMERNTGSGTLQVLVVAVKNV